MTSLIVAPLRELETPRLLLRPMNAADAETIVRWRNTEHVASMRFQTTDAQLTLDHHLAWFSTSRSDRVDYVIELKEDRQPIGSISLTWRQIPGCSSAGEVGKYIGEKPALRKGYASEATVRWLSFAFDEIDLECVISRTRCSNTAIITANQKLGYTICPWPEQFGPASDEWLFMRLTRADWALSRATAERAS